MAALIRHRRHVGRYREIAAAPARHGVGWVVLQLGLGEWFGTDQESGNDDEYDGLFRHHLRNIYRSLAHGPPAELERHIVPDAVVWSFARQVSRIQCGDRLTVRTNCPGVLTWSLDGGEARIAEMEAAGGVMAGVRRYHLTLGPFSGDAREVRFVFRCTCPGCDCRDVCCEEEEHAVRII